MSAALSPGTGGAGAGVHRGLDRAHIAAHHDGDQAGADLLIAHQRNVGGLGHGIGRLDGGHETLGLDHTQSLHHIRHL